MALAEPEVDATQLTGAFMHNPDGWVTAQIKEFPAAISQGRTEHEAWMNVLDAYHDLTHEPTSTERLIYRLQADADRARDLAVEFIEEMVPALGRAGRSVMGVLERQGRDRVH